VVASNPDLFIPLLMRADADGDGALSRSEAPGRIASAFDLLDADGDGLLRPEEIRSTLTKLKELSQRQEPASAGESTRASH
jgi:Ca2+-binding EF-hand superfamily protein